MKYYLGIDLGGTNIVAGVVDENYRIICKEKVKTACPRPAQEIVDDMVRCARSAIANAGLKETDISGWELEPLELRTEKRES